MSSVAAGALPVAVSKAAKESHKSQRIINKIKYPFFSFSPFYVSFKFIIICRDTKTKRGIEEAASTYSRFRAVMGMG